MLSLVVYAIFTKHTSRREICSFNPVPKRCLPIPNDNGREYITSCLSYYNKLIITN